MKNKLTLLYVEDDEIVRENFEIIFSQYFHKIITSDNGKDALELYEKNKIDIAVLDISIPEINGLSLAKMMREKNKELEIIMLTGHSEKDKLLKAINLHLFSYLVKPVKKEQLDDVISRLLKKLENKNTLQFSSDYSFNTQEKTLYHKDEIVKLSKNEKKLITLLSMNRHLHYSACDIAQELFESVNTDISTCNNAVQLISRFKKKMLKLYSSESFFIDKIYGLGYKIV